MKTRNNNDSTNDETLLNQSITRRSFVKRGAVASVATVFGISGGNKANLFAQGLPIGPQSTSLGDYCTYPGSTPYEGVADNEADLAQQVYDQCSARTPWPPEEWLPGYQSVHPYFEITGVGGVSFIRETLPNGKIGFTLRGGEQFQIRHSEILNIP